MIGSIHYLPLLPPTNNLISPASLFLDFLFKLHEILLQGFNIYELIVYLYSLLCQFFTSIFEKVQNRLILPRNPLHVADRLLKLSSQLRHLIFFMSVQHQLKLAQVRIMEVPLMRNLCYFGYDFLFGKVHLLLQLTRTLKWFRNSCKLKFSYIKLYQKMYQDQKVQEIPTSFPNYSKNIFTKPNLVIDHAKDSCRHLDDFISAFTKRIQIEMTYHKNLKDCSKVLDKYVDGQSLKCISFISSAFRVDNQQRGNQAKELADSLRTQVLAPLTQMSKDYSNFTKTCTKNLKKLNKDYVYFKDNYEKYMSNFQENDNQTKEILITKNIYKYTSQFSQEKKNKMISKQISKLYRTMESIKERNQYQKLYKNSVKQYNEIIQIYRKDVTEMLNQIQIKQREQMKLESDCIRKLIVCEISMFKNVEYDLINISKQMENMSGQNDIEAFKKLSQTIDSKEGQKDLSIKEVHSDKSLLSISLKNVQEQYYPWELSMKKNILIRSIIEKRHKQFKTIEQENTNDEEQLKQQWDNIPKALFDPPKGQHGSEDQIKFQESFNEFIQTTSLIHHFWVSENEIDKDKLNEFRQILKKSHFMRIIAYLYIQQYRIEHQVQLKWDNFIKASQLIGVFLSQCEAKSDSFVVKGLLGLFFTFSGTEENSKKLIFQTEPIFNASIWKRDDFWQSAIFESTYQQIANILGQKGETQAETLLREKNIIFSQLASYCHYMLMLGLTPKTVKVVVGRYCRLYEMTTQQNTDLSKMIRNTSKQIKQTSNNQVIKVNGIK